MRKSKGVVVVLGLFESPAAKNGRGLVGLEVSNDGIAIAHVVPNKKAGRAKEEGIKPHLACCEFISSDVIKSQATTLRDRFAALGLSKTPINWVLLNNEYNLLLVETPNVAVDELREAMRWRIKDLISFPVENAIIDIFSLPKDGTRGAAMSYVVVSEKECIQTIVDIIHQSKLKLLNIDIGELALRNLAENAISGQRGVGLVRLRQGQGSVALVKQEQLYLSRQFDLAYNAGLLDELPEDNLVLELQRSVDYYERQLGQVPPGKLLFCGENVSEDKLTDSLKTALPGNSACFSFEEVLNNADEWEESLLHLCAGAIGGALRQGVAA